MRIVTLIAVCSLCVSGSAVAQTSASNAERTTDRPFVFSISTPSTDTAHATVHLDTGFGERPFDVVQGDRPEQRFGLQVAIGHGLTVLARVGIADDERDVSTSQAGEVLYSFLRSPNGGSIAFGMGLRHESAGINVLLGRIAAGRMFSGWRVDGNALFEKPYSTGRDALDLITTVGVARRVVPAVYLGAELIGEDLEGFWEIEEAEGGARVLIGPSVRIAPDSARWQISVAGGPVVHARTTVPTSTAIRSVANARDSYAVRASFSYGF